MSERKRNLRYETLQVHAGQSPAPGTNARAETIGNPRFNIPDFLDERAGCAKPALRRPSDRRVVQ